MSDYNKLLDALHTIQDECRLHIICDDCPFINRNNVTCGVALKTPCDWKIKRDYDIRLFEDGKEND